MKILSLPDGFTVEHADRFTADLKTLAAHDHPHWLRVFGGGIEEDFAWLAMEWMPGGSLAERGRMAEADALHAAAQVADALAAAHSAGLRHRNLTIGECLLADASTVKVSGFAEAIVYESAGQEVGAVWGRLCCSPPERMFEEPEDSRSEIYALGAILFQMLTGGSPYDGETMPELLMDRFDGPPLRLASVVDGIRPATATIVERMLAIVPDERFASWDEVAEILRDTLGTLSQSRSAAPVRPRMSAVPVVKAPVYSAAGGAWFTIVMLAGLVGFGGWYGWKHFNQPPVETVALASEPVVFSTPKPTPAPVPVAAPAPTPAPVVAVIAKVEAPPPSPPPPKPTPPKFDASGWKKYLLESPKRPGIGKGDFHQIPGSGALRLTGNNSGMSGGSDENLFFARDVEGDWTLSVRVSANGGPAGIVARESIGSDRPCVGIFLDADGKLNSVLRESPAARLAPAPVPVAAGPRWLRIVRRGSAISAFHSLDGKQWREAATLNLPSLPKTVPAGFVVWSGTKAKMTGATFEDIVLKLNE